MFLSEMYSRLENKNFLEGTPRFVEKQDWSQSKYRSMIGKIRESGSSILHSAMTSSHSIRQSQHARIDDNIYEGYSGPGVYTRPLNAGNVISNSLSVHHETSGGETENNSTELNPSVFCKDWNLRKQDEPSGFNRDEGSNIFLENRDFVVGKASGFTAVDQKVKRKHRKTEMAAKIPVEMTAHIGFRVTRTARGLNPSLISRPSGSKDRHTMVLTSKGPRDRRMRLSVGTAIKLYCIQDMLGFEQPSQAVEWLIEKSEAEILKLPQVASVSSSHISQYADSTRPDASLSPLQTGEVSTSSQENTCTANGDYLVNLYQKSLGPETCKSSTATTTESNTNGSIVHEEKREHRSFALSSVASNCRTRETANAVPRKLFRAKARERARERTKQKEKRYNLESGIYGIVCPQPSTFCLQGNTNLASRLDMMDETTDSNSNINPFLHSFMFTKNSIMDNQSRLCTSPPPAEIQCSSLATAHYYTPQQEGSSVQSTGAFSSLDPGTFHVPSGQFPQALPAPNTSSSQGVFCPYPLDHARLQSWNLCRCCTIHSIDMPCSYNGANLESLYGRRPSSDKEIFPVFK